MTFEKFWKQKPCLYHALSILIGILFFFTENLFLIFPVFLLLITKKEWLLSLSLMIFSFLYLSYLNPNPFINNQGVQGTGYFEISSLSTKTHHFGKQFLYKGTLKALFPYKDLKNIPITISVPVSGDIKRPPANKAYLIEGVLKETNGYYFFDIKKETAWQPVKNSFSLAEWRYLTKKKFHQMITDKIKNTASSIFLSGIATGDFDDRMMSFQFSRFGLQHIMAISGFHFALIASIFNFIFQLFLSKEKTVFLLLSLLSGYFLFLGFTPSILRAYIMISIFLCGTLIKRTSSALNALGLSLMAVLIIDPTLIYHLGFQFSFMVTASILLFFSKIDLILQTIFQKRPLAIAKEMNFINQHGLILLTFIRQSFSLCIAVNLTALPLTLYHFGQFPFLSIVYNLFFPFLVSISILLLILSFLFPFIPLINDFNSSFTKFTLNFVYNIPQTLDYKLYGTFSFEFLLFYFTSLFLIGVYKQEDELKWI